MNSFHDLRFAPVNVRAIKGVQNGIFYAHKGKRLITAHRKPGMTPFVSGSKMNNGISDFADVPALFPGGWVTLIYNGDGGTGHAKYQPVPFNASDDVIVLQPVSDSATEPALLLMATILTLQCVSKFGFGYKLTLQRLSRQKVMAPVTIDANGKEAVDWHGLARAGRELRSLAQQQISSFRTLLSDEDCVLPTLTFAPVLITDVFESMKAASTWYDKRALKKGEGRNLYLSQTLCSNGVSAIVSDQDQPPEPGRCITLTLKTQAIFYQPCPFYPAQNFIIFRHHLLNADSGMILVTALRCATDNKFSWGHGVSMERLRRTHIMVPVKPNATGQQLVDWAGMRALGRALRSKLERTIDVAIAVQQKD